MMRPTLIGAIALLLVAASHAGTIHRKQLSGPPSEFADHVVPSPSKAGINSESTTFHVQMKPDAKQADTMVWTQTIEVDAGKELVFSLLSPVADKLTVQLTDARGHNVNLKRYAKESFFPAGDDPADNTVMPGTVWTIPFPRVGEWTVKITAAAADVDESNFQRLRATAAGTQGVLIAFIDSDDEEFTYFNTFDMVQGQYIGLVTRMYSESANQGLALPKASTDVITSATMTVIFPDGHTVVEPMHDDGLHSDLEANDGIFGDAVLADQVGQYIFQADVKGTTARGTKFERSTQHVTEVVAKSIELTGSASGAYDSAHDRLTVYIEVEDKSNAAAPAATYRAYAQVWGQSASSNAAVAICWSEAMVDVQQVGGKAVVALEVDARWIAAAKAAAPFVLKDVQLEEVVGYVPVSVRAEIPVTMAAASHALALNKGLHSINASGYNGEITREMRQGIMPAHIRERIEARANGSNAEPAKLIAVHGYCSGKNPFQDYASDFTNVAFYYYGASVSISHDHFSQSVVSWAEDQGFTAYSMIGHSQGGCVGLHSLTYYWTGVDVTADDGSCRKIQSLASPFNGCSAAGNLADLSKAFGGCGANEDLSPSGAVRWVAGLPADAQSQSYRYVTVYAKSGLFGGNCNALTNLVLDGRNDGVSEEKYTKLDYGTQVEFFEGECHIDGMKWPASYANHRRNKEMDAAACR